MSTTRWIVAPIAITLGIATIKGRLVLELDSEERPKRRPRKRRQTLGYTRAPKRRRKR